MESQRTDEAGNRIEELREKGREIRESILERPLMAVGIAAAAGFVVGGGASTRAGMAALLLAVRMAIREILVQAVTAQLHASQAGQQGPVIH